MWSEERLCEGLQSCPACSLSHMLPRLVRRSCWAQGKRRLGGHFGATWIPGWVPWLPLRTLLTTELWGPLRPEERFWIKVPLDSVGRVAPRRLSLLAGRAFAWWDGLTGMMAVETRAQGDPCPTHVLPLTHMGRADATSDLLSSLAGTLNKVSSRKTNKAPGLVGKSF